VRNNFHHTHTSSRAFRIFLADFLSSYPNYVTSNRNLTASHIAHTRGFEHALELISLTFKKEEKNLILIEKDSSNSVISRTSSFYSLSCCSNF